MDCSPPGSAVLGILQARTQEWVAISYSKGSSRPRDQTQIPCIPAWAGGFFTPMPPEKPKNTQDSGKSTIETAVYEILQEITQRDPTRSTHWLQASKPSEFWATCFGGLATQSVVLCHKSLGALAGPHWRENLSPTQLAKVCDHQKPWIWKHLCLARALKPLWPRDTDRKCCLSWCLLHNLWDRCIVSVSRPLRRQGLRIIAWSHFIWEYKRKIKRLAVCICQFCHW